jgi:hypothetical protein
MPDYMPRKDGDFLAWAQNFSSYLAGHAAQMGIPQQEAQEILAGVESIRNNIDSNTAAQDQARAARLAKTTSRQDWAAKTRLLVRRLQASPVVSDAQRLAMGITVPGFGKAASDQSKPTSPAATVDRSRRLRHIIRYCDSAMLTRRARPRLAIGCEIWMALTDTHIQPPEDFQMYRNQGLSLTSPYMVEFDGADAGRAAHYMLRWVLRDNSRGAWSRVVSATVAG